ncbi:MAG: hypothetical protein ACQSGP_17095 [Frankia sp.]
MDGDFCFWMVSYMKLNRSDRVIRETTRGGKLVRGWRVFEGDDDLADPALLTIELDDGIDRRVQRRPLGRGNPA